MRLVIEHEADVNARDESNEAPLHLAVYQVSVESVQLSVWHGLTHMCRTRDISHDFLRFNLTRDLKLYRY
jgi:hypothetical protein